MESGGLFAFWVVAFAVWRTHGGGQTCHKALGGTRVCVATTSHGQELSEAKQLFAICCGRDPQKLSTHTDSYPTPGCFCQRVRNPMKRKEL